MRLREDSGDLVLRVLRELRVDDAFLLLRLPLAALLVLFLWMDIVVLYRSLESNWSPSLTA